jgi:5'-deoxynucleotidase YfbR-like HD superfamily hydrolase
MSVGPAAEEAEEEMTQSKFPPGWDQERVERVLAHYEPQTDEGAATEDAEAWDDPAYTLMAVPADLVPAVRDLIAKHQGV